MLLPVRVNVAIGPCSSVGAQQLSFEKIPGFFLYFPPWQGDASHVTLS